VRCCRTDATNGGTRLGSDVGAVANARRVHAARASVARVDARPARGVSEGWSVELADPWGQVAFALAVGDRGNARAILARAYKRVKNARESILQFAEQRGLLPL
jgi:hypothetical protein